MQKKSAIIRFHGVEVKYGEVHALRGVNLEIPGGKVTVIIGPSGCGKSTMIRTVNRMVEPTKGTVEYQGVDAKQLEKIELRRQMGYAIQNVGLIPHLTVEENIMLVPRLLGWPEERKKKRAHELFELIGLDPKEYGNKYPSELSGGEAQRVGVARALGADPPVLLFDEPFGAVDPLKREELQDEFVRIQRRLKKTVLFITHDLSEAIRLADYMVIMKDGLVVQADAPHRLLKEPANDFVEQFLGADRTLQRLTLLTADRIAKPLRIEGEGLVGASGILWRPLADGDILAVYKGDSGEFLSRLVQVNIHVARPYASLKECVSKFLALGLPAIPLVDDSGEVTAEVLFDDIQRITKEG